jgi:hypothetical protein
METLTRTLTRTGPSKAALRTGWSLTILLALFMTMDGVMKLVKPEPVVKAAVQMGYTVSTLAGIGVVLLICTALYLIPQTAVLGAALLTAYLGGAVASQVRIGASPFSLLFPILFCVLIWVSLLLRESRLRVVFPVRRETVPQG